MLTRLLVDNLTVIERAELEFGPGLQTITGETGAGKTLLATAVRLVSGEKPDVRLVGPRSDEAYVEAAFNDPVPTALVDVADPDDELTLARKLRRGGQSRALCSGRSCSALQLSEAGAQLLSLTGQHAARRLADNGFQLDLIDRAGGLAERRGQVGEAYAAWKASRADLDSLRHSLADHQEREEIIRNQLQAIRELDPQEGEEVALASERDRLRHSDDLRSATMAAYTGLSSDGGAAESLGIVSSELARVAEHDPAAAALSEELGELADRARDAASEARTLAETYASDPGRLEEVEQRLISFSDLRRRFGGIEIAEVLVRAGRMEADIAQIEGGDQLLAEAEAAEQAARSHYDKLAGDLSTRRKKAAAKLGRDTAGELSDLGLTNAELIVELHEAPASSKGCDRAHMALKANAGVEPAPLDTGASGGELARVNLALLLASATATGTYVFDEVDTGIGGETAHLVAAKLAKLAESAQVIVVTHLAQIAVRADRHFVVSKAATDGSTTASVSQLPAEEVNGELARLLGVDRNDPAAVTQAAELLRAGAESQLSVA